MNLNTSQKKAVSHFRGPCCVLAGPGSGKTAVITGRTYNLIHEYGVEPSHILVITYTRAAAAEMRQRFERLAGERTRVTFGTFHAVFFMVLKYAYHMSGDNIITEEQRYQLMRELISRHPIDYRDEKDLIHGLLGEIGCIKNSRKNLAEFSSNQCEDEIFRDIFREYEQRLHGSRLIDFDDMLTYTCELFSERPDILSAWQRKYEYILIDEFQDINPIQYDIVRMLALPENNLFIVGDDDQSIYRFRGSEPGLMLGFREDYPEAEQIVLDVNYRCDAHVVADSLRLIGHNRMRFEKEIRPGRHGRNPVIYHCFPEQREENEYVIRQILNGRKANLAWGDFAVLFRTNTQPRLLMQQMLAQNIPFRTREHVPNLYEHWIARDIFTYIRIARGGRARKDFLQIMNRPKRYLSRDSLPEETVAFDVWIKYYEKQNWIADRIELLEAQLRMIAKLSPFAAVNYIRKAVGYEDFLREYAGYRHIDVEELLDTLEEFHAAAAGFSSYEKWQGHIRQYSEHLEEMARRRTAETDAVTLATLHSAKGLEFNCVFVIDVNEGIMPYHKAELPEEIEEERRMFYVGMTRAKKHLAVLSTKKINHKDMDVSRFVAEARGQGTK